MYINQPLETIRNNSFNFYSDVSKLDDGGICIDITSIHGQKEVMLVGRKAINIVYFSINDLKHQFKLNGIIECAEALMNILEWASTERIRFVCSDGLQGVKNG